LQKKEEEMPRLTDIKGMDPVLAEKLEEVGIKTIERLLQIAGYRNSREDLADAIGISTECLHKWVLMADLMRIKGIGDEYCDLLKEVGVEMLEELRTRQANTLYQAMIQLNAQKRLVRRLPSLNDVSYWIDEANDLDPLVTY
jgi:predicted flap endonuclease-1-like 5' DNA nuclease